MVKNNNNNIKNNKILKNENEKTLTRVKFN